MRTGNDSERRPITRLEIQVPLFSDPFEELRHLDCTMAIAYPNTLSGYKSLIILADDESLVYLKLKYADFQKDIMEIF